MSLFRLNIVFHKFLVPECYEELTQEDIEAHIRFVAVNGKITKEIPNRYARFTITESSLQWYNPFLQHNRFCESSVFFHAWRNPSTFLEQPYIGFFHYDMIIKKELLDFLTEHIGSAEKAGKKLFFAPYCDEARVHLQQIITMCQWNNIIQFYNSIFGTSYNIHDVIDREIPLYHTFVMHKELFHQMMFFAELVVPRLFEMLDFDTRHFPFMIERLHGVFIALHRMGGKTGEWLSLPGVIHEDRLKDSWDKAPEVKESKIKDSEVRRKPV